MKNKFGARRMVLNGLDVQLGEEQEKSRGAVRGSMAKKGRVCSAVVVAGPLLPSSGQASDSQGRYKGSTSHTGSRSHQAAICYRYSPDQLPFPLLHIS